MWNPPLIFSGSATALVCKRLLVNSNYLSKLIEIKSSLWCRKCLLGFHYHYFFQYCMHGYKYSSHSLSLTPSLPPSLPPSLSLTLSHSLPPSLSLSLSLSFSISLSFSLSLSFSISHPPLTKYHVTCTYLM